MEQIENSNYKHHVGSRLLKVVGRFPCLREMRLRCSGDGFRTAYDAQSKSQASMPYEVYRNTCIAMNLQTYVLILENFAWQKAFQSGRLATSYPIYTCAEGEYVRLVMSCQFSKLQAGV